MKCRHCQTPLLHCFLDLGFAPHSNAYLNAEDLCRPENYYPLRLLVCDACWLVQTEDYSQANELFSADYAYFSSTSSGWLDHARRYVDKTIEELKLTQKSLVVEVASNDGYLLKNYVTAGIPCLGIEPTASTAAVAENLGIKVLKEFFGEALGRRLANDNQQADLIVGNNVFAHVPDINDFARGLKALLKPNGCITLEFPHLLQLITQTQFDTVYHEHFSYLSLFTVESIFASAGLRVWKVEMLSTHGGSLRIFGCHAEDVRSEQGSVSTVREFENQAGLRELATYSSFQARADLVKDGLLSFLIEAKRKGKSVAAYGAAAKGNTLLNYAGVKPDLLPFVCDAAVAKQNKFMPGSHIPIFAPAELALRRPDYLVILPWNIAEEVRQQNSELEQQGVRFVIAVPELKVL